MKTALIVFDEDGLSWLVAKGDPAWDLVCRLKRPDIILPRETIIRASVPHSGRVGEQARRLSTAFQTTGDPDVRDAFLRATALHDCLSELARS